MAATCPICHANDLIVINSEFLACTSCSSTVSSAGFLAAAQRRLEDRREQVKRQAQSEVTQ